MKILLLPIQLLNQQHQKFYRVLKKDQHHHLLFQMSNNLTFPHRLKLNYLKKKNIDRYNTVIERLGLRR